LRPSDIVDPINAEMAKLVRDVGDYIAKHNGQFSHPELLASWSNERGDDKLARLPDPTSGL
jgi:hypothetical protein